MKKTTWIILAAVLGVCLFAGVKGYRYWYDHKVPNFEGSIDVYVYPWMEPETVRDSILASGKVRKAASLKRVFKDEAILFFLLPPDTEELGKRLMGRGSETEESFARRFSAAQSEIEQYKDMYDYVVVNHDVADTARQINQIVQNAHKA